MSSQMVQHKVVPRRLALHRAPHMATRHCDLQELVNRREHLPGKSLALMAPHALTAHLPEDSLSGSLYESSEYLECLEKPCEVLQFAKLDRKLLAGSSKHPLKVGLPHE